MRVYIKSSAMARGNREQRLNDGKDRIHMCDKDNYMCLRESQRHEKLSDDKDNYMCVRECQHAKAQR